MPFPTPSLPLSLLRGATALAFCVLAGFAHGCGTIHSNLQIEPGKQFLLGGGSRGAFVVEARNVGQAAVVVFQRSLAGKDTPAGTLPPSADAEIEFSAGTTAVLRNDTGVMATLALTIRGDTALGMRYEPRP